MNLFFWTPRANHLKIYGPIADAARKRGHRAVAVIPVEGFAGGKADAELRHIEIREAVGATWRVRSAADLLSLLRYQRPSWVICVGLGALADVRGKSRDLVRWASLDHIQESLLQVIEDGVRILDGWDLAATGSKEGIAALDEQLADRLPMWNSPKQANTLRAVGYPHLDPLVSMDKAACRAKWNLPAGRIVLLAPAARPALLDPWWWRAYIASNPLWRRFCWLKVSRWSQVRDDRHLDESVSLMPYGDILRAFRRWADRHGAFVVAKVRDKTPYPRMLDGIADRVIGDEAFHPFTTLELCRAADAYVGLASAMAIEAMAAGLPQIHVLAYPSEAYEVPAYLPFRRRFYSGLGGLWQSQGVGLFRVYDARDRRSFLSWADHGAWPAVRSADDPEPLWRMAGPPDGRASERFLDALTELS